MPEFRKVASKADVPRGQSKLVRVLDKEIALFNGGGKFYALDNLCPHRGGPLSEGAFDGAVVTCPWHGWQFSVADGGFLVNPSVKAPSYPVKVKGDDVFVKV
ncbi:MAG: Rieske (2Fe-2S) protein [Elusimicrobiota bacterium]